MPNYLIVTASFFILGNNFLYLGILNKETGEITVPLEHRCISFSDQKLYLIPEDGAEDYLGIRQIPTEIEYVLASQIWPSGIPLELRTPSFGRLISSGGPLY